MGSNYENEWLIAIVKEILSCVPQSNLATGVSEVDLGFDPPAGFETLGLTWDPENDKFCVNI